jgi:predicted outer membrane protein
MTRHGTHLVTMKRSHAMFLFLGLLAPLGCGPPDDALTLEPGDATGIEALSVRSLLSFKDQRYLRTVAINDINEMSLAALALDKAVVPHVRIFAEQMQGDHRAMRDAKQALAQVKAARLPQRMSLTSAGKRLLLSRLSGEAFDVAYMEGQVADHTATLTLLQTIARSADDADLRAMAAHDVEIVGHHLRDARALSRGETPR